MRTRPLAGIKVADFTHVLSGPVCTRTLQLLGAEVRKIESCGAGDIMRRYGPGSSESAMSPTFRAINGGKRSIALDIKSVGGRAVARRLIDASDIVVENFRPGVMDAIGLGYDTVKEGNPRLIYCSISGYGQHGPLARAPAFDNVIQGMSGMMTVSGEVGSGAVQAGFLPADSFVGHLAAQAILAALVQRERFGVGDHLDVAMLDASLLLMIALTGPYLTGSQRPEKMGNRAFGIGPAVDVFPTAAGELVLGAFTDAHFETLFALFGSPDTATDARFATERARRANAAAVKEAMARGLATRPALEWEGDLLANSVPAAAVRELPEAISLEHLASRGFVRPLGDERHLGLGFIGRNIEEAAAEPSPVLGEHGDAVLRSIGYSTEEIALLREEGAIA